MRLIDADKLKYAHFVQRGDQPIGYEGTQPVYDYTELIAYDIGNAPTVKAIPIEWIQKWITEHIWFDTESVNWLLKDWEKENETN